MAYTEEYLRCLERNDIHYTIENREDVQIVRVAGRIKVDKARIYVVSVFEGKFIHTIIMADIYVNDISKREACLRMLNEANDAYKIGKFILDSDGEVVYKHVTYLLHSEFDPERYMLVISAMINSFEEMYPKFKRLQWG